MRRSRRFARRRPADPDDRHGASLRLMRLGAEPVAGMPQAYVQALFDQYAPRFESALVDDLGYRGPALLFKAVLSVRAAARKPAFFKRAIDLGCGTGLAATAFAREVDHFIGIDLSPRMIEQARATGLYAELEVADMLRGPARQAGCQRRSHSRRRRDGLCRRSRAGAGRGHARAGAPAACWPSPPKPMAARASSSARGCAMPIARPMCARRSRPPGSSCRCWKICSARNEDNVPVPGLVVGRGKNLSLGATLRRELATALRRKSAIRYCRRFGNVSINGAHPGRNNNEQQTDAARIRRHRACRHRCLHHARALRLGGGEEIRSGRQRHRNQARPDRAA